MILILGANSSESTIHDYGTHTVAVTHLDGFRTNVANLANVFDGELGVDGQEVGKKEIQKNGPSLSVATKKTLGKNELRGINLAATKTINKSKAFKAAKQHICKKDSKSSINSKKSKLEKKFSKKSAKSKRSKHFHPKKITS